MISPGEVARNVLLYYDGGFLSKILKAIDKPEPELSAAEKTIKELNEKIEQAEGAGSYFVTISRKEDEKLFHWMGSVRFPNDDRAHSLRELLRQIPTAQKEGEKVRRFTPRKHGG